MNTKKVVFHVECPRDAFKDVSLALLDFIKPWAPETRPVVKVLRQSSNKVFFVKEVCLPEATFMDESYAVCGMLRSWGAFYNIPVTSFGVLKKESINVKD